MKNYDEIFTFENLMKAHQIARKGKRETKEMIEFEMNLSRNLTVLYEQLHDCTYRISGYYSFYVHDPKKREIHALHYKDRVVQHALCDEYLNPLLDSRLIYDNIACRENKGTHFGIKRITQFLSKHYTHYGNHGYFLKCDIRKFFDHIDHEILKTKLRKVVQDQRILSLLFGIIDSYHFSEGKGLPLGNQTSQWFALYYLDGLDRLVKEKLQIKYYSRYMDDCVLIHHDKAHLQKCLKEMKEYIESELLLEFNEKTQIFPISNGVDYLGFHFYVSQSGKIIRRVRNHTKKKYRRKLKYIMHAYKHGMINIDDIFQILNSYDAHLSYGHNDHLKSHLLHSFVLMK